MNIINNNFPWINRLKQRQTTQWIVLHHTATVKDSVANIDNHHRVANGWLGFGYHFFISKKGEVFAGRPLNTEGTHVLGYNHSSIGICFEGNYEVETMPQAQIEAGIELVRYVHKMYPEARITRHKDLNQNSCPGKNFNNQIIIKAMEILEPKKVEPVKVEVNKKFTDKLSRLKKLDQPTTYEEVVDRLLQIYDNSFKTTKEELQTVRKILKRG